MTSDYLDHYREHGFAVVEGLFDAAEVAELAEAFDRVYARAISYKASFRHQNVFFQLGCDPALGQVVRMAQWPSYFDKVLSRVRTDARMADILRPLIGGDLKQIINQMHWKPPGASHVEFGFHQDARFRRPAEAYRDLASSYVQTGIAIDPHSAESGEMVVYPGSHRLGIVEIRHAGRVLDAEMREEDLSRAGLDPDALVTLELAPGDLALWNPYLIHGSGPNHTARDRRFYINGYVSADKCDRGEWAFRGGRPCALGEPVLVHYEQLYERPEPHLVEAG